MGGWCRQRGGGWCGWGVGVGGGVGAPSGRQGISLVSIIFCVYITGKHVSVIRQGQT